MKLRAILFGAAILLAAIIVVKHRLLSSQPAESSFEPVGYVHLVNRGFGDRLKFVSTSTARTEDHYTLTPRLVAPQNEALVHRLFLERSYLSEDLEYPERFDRGSNDQARLRTGFRRRSLPFAEQRTWLGRARFRDSGDKPRLRSESGQVLIFEARASKDGPIPVPFPSKPDPKKPPQIAHAYKWELGGRLSLQLVAHGSAIVAVVPPEAPGTIWINGERTPSSGARRSILAGDWLALEDGRGNKEVFHLEQATSGIASQMVQGPQGIARAYSPVGAVESLVKPLAESLAIHVENQRAALEWNEHPPASKAAVKRARLWIDEISKRDVVLSLDENLQAVSQKALEEFLDRERGKSYWRLGREFGHAPRTPPVASLAIMDVATGEVLSAATYPVKETLDVHLRALGSAMSNAKNQALLRHAVLTTLRKRDRLLANHVLDQHQIGSLVKPLFATAAALSFRGGEDPLEMQVDCKGKTEGFDEDQIHEIRGIPLARFDDDVHGHVDFRHFLSKSCHTFMFELGARALEREKGFSVDKCHKRLNAVLTGVPRESPQSSAFATYAWMFDALIDDPETTGRWLRDRRAWGRLGEELEAHAGQFGCDPSFGETLAIVSPEQVNLKASGMIDCSPDFQSFLKGGGTNRWSDLQLAAAFARLATGRRVEARLVVEERPAPEPLAFANVQRFEKVRAAVLDGLSRVLRYGEDPGTAATTGRSIAAALGDLELATGKSWGAYAKTGSSLRDHQAVLAVDDKFEPKRTKTDKVPVASFVLMLLECDGREKDQFGCERLASPERGFVITVWVDAVPGIRLGPRAAEIFNARGGKALLKSLAEHVGGMSAAGGNR